MKDQLLAGKSAIVTGAARGIGREIAMQFAACGADVLVNTRSQESLDAVYEDVKKVAKGKVTCFLADVSDEAQVDAMFDHALAEFGKVNIVANNAGVSASRAALYYDSKFWDENLKVNLYSAYYTCIRAAKELVKQGLPGSFINFSSIGATKPHRNCLAYDTSKAALEGLTRALALELAPFEIRVNAISPASILGFYVKEMPEEIAARRDPMDFATPLTRQGTPEEVANLVSFLASDESSYITGQVIAIDGGISVQARPNQLAPLMVTPENLDKSLL